MNRTLEAKAREVAGWKGYTTNLATRPDGAPVSAEFVIDAYHRLYQIEASFRMSKHDLAARPIYHHQRESIEANSPWCSPPSPSGGSSRTALAGRSVGSCAPQRRYRTVQIRAGQHLLTAQDLLPADLADALAKITGAEDAH